MQNWRCQLAFSVLAVRVGKNARLSTDVVQSDETAKPTLPFVSDGDDDARPWPGDQDFLSESDAIFCVCSLKLRTDFLRVVWCVPLFF